PVPAPTAQPPPLRSAPPSFAYPPRRPRRGGAGWKIFAFILLVLLVLSLVANPLHWFLSFASGDGALPQHHSSGPRLQENYVKDNNSAHRIVIVPIEGVISSQSFGRGGPTMVEVVEEQFKRAADDKRVKAVILKVN